MSTPPFLPQCVTAAQGTMVTQPCVSPALPCATSTSSPAHKPPNAGLTSVFLGIASLIFIDMKEVYGGGCCCSRKISLNSSCLPYLQTQLWLFFHTHRLETCFQPQIIFCCQQNTVLSSCMSKGEKRSNVNSSLCYRFDCESAHPP